MRDLLQPCSYRPAFIPRGPPPMAATVLLDKIIISPEEIYWERRLPKEACESQQPMNMVDKETRGGVRG